RGVGCRAPAWRRTVRGDGRSRANAAKAGAMRWAPRAGAAVPGASRYSAIPTTVRVSAAPPKRQVLCAALPPPLEPTVPSASSLLAFASLALGLALTPGPNMMYLVSRSICQGRQAGLISLGGVALGFLLYMVAAALGITALLFAVPLAYDALRLTGTAYLLYL